MASLFDVFGRLLLDDAQFQTDVAKSADKAGLTASQRMSAALRGKGAQALGATLAAGTAIATKGLIELDAVTAKFAADTGATAEEARKAGKAINAMAGRNLQPMEEVGDALAKVHTDLGLSGEAAEATTEQFLKFATATGQDASDAVLAFDDILDNWGLTADDAQGIMDKLVVSHQKFGGSVTDNQKTLAKLAPAMKAANFEIDDGIGLLGLFGAKGLDSERAAAAFSKALTKVKSPEELKALIADIQATEDPFLRAQKAADLFGAKAGAQLANALGGANLDDYAISVDEAAGATAKAAGVIEDSFGNRIKLAFKGASAALIDFGSNFGPAVTGLASLASVGATLGGGKLVKGVAGLGGKLAGAILNSAAGAPVLRAWGAVGDKAATAYLKTLLAGDALAAGLKGAVTKVARSTAITGALDKAGSLWGGKLGTAVKAGFLLALGTIIVDLLHQLDDLNRDIAAKGKDIGNSVGEQIASGTLESLQQSRGALAAGVAQLDSALGPLGGFSQARADLVKDLAEVDAAIDERMRTSAAGARTSARDIATSVQNVASKTQLASWKIVGDKGFGRIEKGIEDLAKNVYVDTGKIADYLKSLTAKMLGEAQAMIDGYYDPIIAAEELQVQKTEVAARRVEVAEAKKAVAATKSGTTARKEAQATLDAAELALTQSEKAYDQMRANLLAAGQLSAKDQAAWLTELEKKYKTATGSAKTDIGNLIDKIHELQRNNSVTIEVRARVAAASAALQGVINQTRTLANRQVNFGVSGGIPRAVGGPVTAGRVYRVGEHGPEMFVPQVNGAILTAAETRAMSSTTHTTSPASGDTNINVRMEGLPLHVETPYEVSQQLRRLADNGYLTPATSAGVR